MYILYAGHTQAALHLCAIQVSPQSCHWKSLAIRRTLLNKGHLGISSAPHPSHYTASWNWQNAIEPFHPHQIFLNDFEYRRIPSSHQRKLSEQSWESQTNVNWQLFNSDSTIDQFNHLGSTAHYSSWEVDIGVYHGQHGQHESEGDRKVLLQVLWFKPRSGRVVGKAGETGAGAERLDETRTGPHNLAPLEDEVAERRGGSRKRQGRDREETGKKQVVIGFEAERCWKLKDLKAYLAHRRTTTSEKGSECSEKTSEKQPRDDPATGQYVHSVLESFFWGFH